MYKIPVIILLIALCGCHSVGERDSPLNPSEKEANIESQNLSWGEPILAIDFSGKTLFKDDNRIDSAHKRALPTMLDSYVLWRVKHDGSCWVSSALTLLLYQMIEGGDAKFDDVLKKMKAFVDDNVPVTAFDHELGSFDEFFAIFKLIRNNMTHRFSLELRNHQNIYDKLDKGMRILIITFLKMLDPKRAQEIERNRKSWGSCSEFKFFFDDLGIKTPVVDLKGFESVPMDFDPTKTSLPKMLIIKSTDGFIDVLVEKNFSDRVNR